MDQLLCSADKFAMSVGYVCRVVLLISEQTHGKLSPSQVRFSPGPKAVQQFESGWDPRPIYPAQTWPWLSLVLALVQARQGLTSVCKHCIAILSLPPGLILQGSVPCDALPITLGQINHKL